jgi:hypothetical protein
MIREKAVPEKALPSLRLRMLEVADGLAEKICRRLGITEVAG